MARTTIHGSSCSKDRKGSLRGLAPLALRRSRFAHTLTFAGDAWNGIETMLCTSDTESELSASLLQALVERRREWDVWRVQRLPTTSTLAHTLLNGGGALRAAAHDIRLQPFLALPSDVDAYEASFSAKQRNTLRRKWRKLTELGAVPRMVSDPNEIESALRVLLDLRRQRAVALGQNYEHMDARFERFLSEVVRELLPDRVHLWTLQLDGRTLATHLNLVQGPCEYSYLLGLSDDHANLSPGNALEHHAIHEAIREGRAELDFGPGRDAYKYRLGGRDRELTRLVVGSPTARGRAIAMIAASNLQLRGTAAAEILRRRRGLTPERATSQLPARVAQRPAPPATEPSRAEVQTSASVRTEHPHRTHVLTLVDRLSITGGAEHIALDIATRLDPSRFRSTLCASRFAPTGTPNSSERQGLDLMHAAGTGFIPLRRRSRIDFRSWRRLAAYVRNEHVKVIHAHMFGSNVWGTVIGRLTGVPVIIAHEHSRSFEGEPLMRLLDRELIARHCDAFIAVSCEDRRKMIELERIPTERIRVLANGIAAETPTPGRDLRAELDLGRGPLIGAVGGLRAVKAYDVLIRAAAHLHDRHPDLRVLIAGDGEERPRLEALIRELGLADVVVMLGAWLDVPDLLAALDVAVCTSEREGSPLSVMEYMEAELPIVATRVGGIPDLIDDGVHGLLVEPGNPEALAAAIDDLLSDRTRASALGKHARERRRREFDLDVMVHNVEALYTELLAARTAR